MANTTGKKFGGRKKGSVNKRTAEMHDLIKALVEKGKSYIEKVLDDEVSCSVCKGTGEALYLPAHSEKVKDRRCSSCRGRGYEKLSPDTILRAALGIIEYGHAKRKAIEVSNALDENGDREEFKIRFVGKDAKEQ